MPQPQKTEDLARRDLLRLGLAGASVLVLGSVRSGHAGEMHNAWGRAKGAEGGGL